MTGSSDLGGRGEIRDRWPLVLSAAVGVACSSLVLPFYTMGVLTNPLTTAFGWTRGDVQFAILFSSGLGALTAPVIGWLSDRYGPRALALPGLLGLSCGFLIAASMNGELWMYYLAYGSMALLGAGTTPVTWTRAIATSFDRQRGLALGLALSGTGVCGILVPHYAVWLVERFGWRGAYIGLAILPIVLAGPIVFFGFKPRSQRSRDPVAQRAITEYGATLAEAVASYRFWVLGISILAVYLALAGIGANLMPALTDHGFTRPQAASMLSVFGIAVILGRLAVGYLVDRIWAPAVAAVALGLPLVGCLILMQPAGLLLIAVATLLIGAAAGAELDLMSFLATKYFGVRHYAKIYALLYSLLAVAGGTAPMLFARAYDLTASYDTSFMIAAGLFAFGSLVLLTLGRYPRFARAVEPEVVTGAGLRAPYRCSHP